jgi:hypothetical protein
MVSSMFLSSCTSAKHLWESNPTGFCSGNFSVEPQLSTNDPRVVGGAGIQMREDAADQYLSYKLIESNQD